MARQIIDTVGTGDTVPSAFAKVNAMTSELYTALQATSASNMVNLNLYRLTRATAFYSAPATANYVTMAVKVRWPATPAGYDPILIADNGAFVGLSLGVSRINDTTSYAYFTIRSAGTANVGLAQQILDPGPLGVVFTTGTYYTIHIMAWRTGSGGGQHGYRVWVNGVEKLAGAWGNATNPLNFTSMTNTAIGGAYTVDSTFLFKDLIGFIYVGAGTTSEWGITDPTKFYNAGDVYLGPSGQTPNNLQPLIFLGGQHSASEWNAGVNFGYGGNFTPVTP